MKNVFLVIFSLFIFHIGEALSVATVQDFKGGKDHPLVSRMPDFHISDYKEAEFNSQRFIGAEKKTIDIEGHKYYIEYRINTGAPEPGELKIRKTVQMLLLIP